MTTPHQLILRLARSGSLERAWSLMEHHGLLDSDTDQRALTLQARLVKDRAKRVDGAERAQLFAESAAIYAKAGALENGSYPLINAASLSLLAGQRAQSEKLARDVLAGLDANPDEAETPYWLGATRAEALLLLGQKPEARAALRKAVTKQPAAWEDHAATIGQFELLCGELDCDAAWLDQLRPPSAVRFSGIMNVEQSDPAVEAQIADWLERENIGFGYGALAAGSDIWIAEALLERGAELHVVLPCDRATFREISVIAIDDAWEARFDTLMEQAETVECLDQASIPDAAAVERGDRVAFGLAMHQAGQLRSSAKRLRIIGDADNIDETKVADVALLKARRCKAPALRQVETGAELSAVLASRQGVRTFDSLAKAWDAARTSDAVCAVDWIVVQEHGELSSAVTDRLSAMVGCAEAGQCLATQAAGFGLLGHSDDVRVESAGEMRWAGGQMPLFALL
ncbi:tetratricopeptide repeat-containing protein [Pontixanthobacter sp. CEM42]|uniref:tetratricopeptide repeat-containing protein n=1 Tax=Pontixanthobacter sp. CEM42 TaxID=2792077 RepID=UPI001ADF51A4|nr:tetratricopeptide repeat-containing protein [Pontixanthobacter sp. CEM42]